MSSSWVTLYYSLGGTDHIKKAAAAALTWAAGGRTAEVCGISFMMMEYTTARTGSPSSSGTGRRCRS